MSGGAEACLSESALPFVDTSRANECLVLFISPFVCRALQIFAALLEQDRANPPAVK